MAGGGCTEAASTGDAGYCFRRRRTTPAAPIPNPKEVTTGSSRTLNITLSADAAQFVQSKVSSGEYASETAAIQEGIEALRHEADVLKCFESEIVRRHDALMADPS